MYMNKKEIFEKIINFLKNEGAKKISIFGSYLRGEEKSESDIDIIVEFSERKSLLELVRMERELSEVLGIKVDLLTEKSMSPYLIDLIKQRNEGDLHTKKDDAVYLKHILDAINRIEEYTHNIEYKDFIENYLVQDGVIRQIEIIGEATKKLSNEIKEKYIDIPWKDIIGMRNKLIHNYFGVDVDTVWDTVKKDIPILKNKLMEITLK